MPITNIGYEITNAIKRVSDGARHWPSSHMNDNAITFVRAVLPPYHPARLDVDRAAAALATLRKHLAPTDGADRKPNDHVDVTLACAAATKHVETTPVELRVITGRAELGELHREIGVRPNWREPDEQDISVTITDGSFDNAFAITDLETGVVIHQEGNPIAYISLATLFSLATRDL